MGESKGAFNFFEGLYFDGMTVRIDLKEIIVNMRNWLDSTQDVGYWRELLHAPNNLRVP